VIALDQSLLLDEAGRMLSVVGLIMVVLLTPMMVVSLVISIIQAATSISEQSLSLVPKLIVLLFCLAAFGAAIAELLIKFTSEIFGIIAAMGRG
jgi:flagellar biosynthetic protein FliQ